MKKAMLLHAWFGNPEHIWYPWLKNELEKKGYKVWVPALPTMPTKNPDLGEMLRFILKEKFVDQETIVIGHSLGAVLALRLAEKVAFAKGILLAAWDFNDLTPGHQSFWQTMMNHAEIKKNVKDWVFLISDNDPYVTKFIAHEVAERVSAKAVEVGPRGHFGEADGVREIPEILDYV